MLFGACASATLVKAALLHARHQIIVQRVEVSIVTVGFAGFVVIWACVETLNRSPALLEWVIEARFSFGATIPHDARTAFI